MSKQCCDLSKEDLSDEDFDVILDELRGETMSNRWEAVDVREQNDENENIEDWAVKHI